MTPSARSQTTTGCVRLAQVPLVRSHVGCSVGACVFCGGGVSEEVARRQT